MGNTARVFSSLSGAGAALRSGALNGAAAALRGGTAWLLVLAGCSASVAPIEVAAGCPERPLRGPSRFADEPGQQLIDDFEHDSAFIPKLEGRDGLWILGSDETEASLDANGSEQCAGRGGRSGHFAGAGFTSWGANWTALLRDSKGGRALPYDATRYGGISFWAAVSADTATPFTLPVGVTTMDVAWNGGICARCMDYYRAEVPIDHDWRRVELRFDQLEQSGNGDPLVDLRRDELVGVILWPQSDFDLWIDDLRFEP